MAPCPHRLYYNKLKFKQFFKFLLHHNTRIAQNPQPNELVYV